MTEQRPLWETAAKPEPRYVTGKCACGREWDGGAWFHARAIFRDGSTSRWVAHCGADACALRVAALLRETPAPLFEESA